MTDPITLEVAPPHANDSCQAPRDGVRGDRMPGNRLEMLTALVDGPRFDPLFRGQALIFPPDDRPIGGGVWCTRCRPLY